MLQSVYSYLILRDIVLNKFKDARRLLKEYHSACPKDVSFYLYKREEKQLPFGHENSYCAFSYEPFGYICDVIDYEQVTITEICELIKLQITALNDVNYYLFLKEIASNLQFESDEKR